MTYNTTAEAAGILLANGSAESESDSSSDCFEIASVSVDC